MPAYMATQKYCDALPTYRQSEIFKRAGLELYRTNLANWMMRCGELVQPLINLLQEQQLEQPVTHLDETTVQVLNEPGKSAESQTTCEAWAASQSVRPSCSTTPTPAASRCHWICSIRASAPSWLTAMRATKKPANITASPESEAGPAPDASCVDAKAIQRKGKTCKADQGLAFIQKLYPLERRIKDQPPDERCRRRQQEAIPQIDKLRAWLEKSLSQVPPQTVTGKARRYLNTHWPAWCATWTMAPTQSTITERGRASRVAEIFSLTSAGISGPEYPD